MKLNIPANASEPVATDLADNLADNHESEHASTTCTSDDATDFCINEDKSELPIDEIDEIDLDFDFDNCDLEQAIEVHEKSEQAEISFDLAIDETQPANPIPINNDQIDLSSIPFDQEIESVRQQYCECSGKPLCKVPEHIVEQLITIHGRETAIKILQTQQRKVSLEWIWLNSDGLDKLAFHDPQGYFVYAASKLLQDLTIHNELMRLHEAANAWQLLQSIDQSILSPINELLRRLLANYERGKLNKHMRKFANKSIHEIANSIANLTKFQLELTNLIQQLHDEKKKQDAYNAGISTFRAQSMITALSQLELSVGKEFNDFDLIDGKTPEAIEAIVGRKYGKVKKDMRKVNYSQKAIVNKKPKPFKLKIGGNK